MIYRKPYKSAHRISAKLSLVRGHARASRTCTYIPNASLCTSPREVFRETLMNVLRRENTHGYSQSQSNSDQRRVDALPRLIKQRVAPVRKMQIPSPNHSKTPTSTRAACTLCHMLRYILRLNLHTYIYRQRETAWLRTHTQMCIQIYVCVCAHALTTRRQS